MRIIIFYLLVLFCLPFQLVAQCPATTILMNTQSQVDDFSVQFPNCTELNGGLVINSSSGTDITSLSGLSQLTSIGGSLTIESNDQLANLEGLHNLTSVNGTLALRLNDVLANISALNNLNQIETVEIFSNNALTNIEGFLSEPSTLNYLNILSNENLQTIDGFAGLSLMNNQLRIMNNNSLSNIEGFNSLDTIYSDLIIQSNPALTTLSGFNNLQEVGRNLVIAGTNLVSTSAFENLTIVGNSLEIKDNPSLVSLTHLVPQNGLGRDLVIENNASLNDVQALSTLNLVPRGLTIKNNDALTNVVGTENINKVRSLNITENNLLTDLSGFQSLDTIETNLGLYGNGTLADLSGFSSLTSVQTISLGTPSIGNSSGVQSLDGLQGLTSLPFLNVFNSNSLSSLQGLENVTNMHTLTLWGVRPLANLHGLESLDSINFLNITFCYDLQSLEGLNNLEIVTDVFLLAANDELTNLDGLTNLKKTGTLQININDALTSLDGIGNLEKIDSTFRMHRNDNLVDISAIQNTNIETLGLLRISDNPLLSVCSYDNICNYLTSGGNNSIYGNNAGCANQIEVFDVCISSQNNTRLQGNVWADVDLDCSVDADEAGIPKVLLYLQGDNYEYFFPADSAGNYDVPVLAGDYNLSIVSPSAYWMPCFFDTLLTASGTNDTIQTDFFIQPQGDCSYVDWFLNLNGLRVCGTRSATLDLCNRGVQTAETILTNIDLGNFVTLESASVPYSTNPDGTISIVIDSLELFECLTIDLELFTDCDSVSIDDILCLDVSFITDDICAPDTLWDESNIQASGYCEGDSIYFLLENIGAGDMLAPAEYEVQILIEDIVLLIDDGNYQLQSGQSSTFSYPNIGEGYHLKAKQTEGYPIASDARATVSTCQEFMEGIGLNFFPSNSGNPAIGTFCTFAANSFDPNIKSAIPVGTGEEHFIEKDWQLDYTIQFQNTGNDVAYEVIIRDTISENLDLRTLQVRGASHNFTWTINENRELAFTFANILLPDSTSNEPESHGMVSYSISPRADILPLTVIENRAGIYFDFNDPIITNTVFHTIRKPVRTIVEQKEWCAGTAFNNIPIHGDTAILEITEFLEYDSAHLTFLSIVDTIKVEEMVNAQVGDVFENIEITGDTSFVINHISTNGCDSIVTYNISTATVSIADLENPFSEVRIFPNPTAEKLFIDASQMEEVQTYALRNTLGMLVWQKIIHPVQTIESIDLTNVPAGIYWLEGKSEQERKVWKIVVNR